MTGLHADSFYLVLAGGITVYSLGDMALYNRRKKKEWYADQHQKWQEALRLAREAEALGRANEGQMMLLQQERAAEAAEQARKERSVWRAIKRLFSWEGLKAEEDRPEGDSAPTNQFLPQTQSFMQETVEERRRGAEREMENQGVKPGPLDRMAEQATQAVFSKNSSDVD